MLQLYKNIKKRRTELHLTQSELATKMGYADKSMIAKIEKGLVDLPQSKIIAFAETLQISPGDLMGWDEQSIEIKYNTLSSYNSELLNRFAEYLYLSERQAITNENRDKYLDFIVSSKINKLNSLGKNEALKRITELTKISWYTNDDSLELNAAQARTDIDIPEGIDTSDDDIMDSEDF